MEPTKKPRYRALVGVHFPDGKDEDGNPKELRVEAGSVIPARFKIPEGWIGRKVEET